MDLQLCFKALEGHGYDLTNLDQTSPLGCIIVKLGDHIQELSNNYNRSGWKIPDNVKNIGLLITQWSFIQKKGPILFEDSSHIQIPVGEEPSLPPYPVEMFRKTTPTERRNAFYSYLKKGTILYLQMINEIHDCYKFLVLGVQGGAFFLSDLNITAFLPKLAPDMKRIPKGLKSYDLIRGVLCTCSVNERKLFVTLDSSVIMDKRYSKIKLGPISYDDLPKCVVNPAIKSLFEYLENTPQLWSVCYQDDLKRFFCMKDGLTFIDESYKATSCTETECGNDLRKQQNFTISTKKYLEAINLIENCGEEEEAIFTRLNEALLINPINLRAVVTRGFMNIQVGKIQSAFEDTETALKIMVEYKPACKQMSCLLVGVVKKNLEEQNFDKAEEALKFAEMLDKNNPDIQNLKTEQLKMKLHSARENENKDKKNKKKSKGIRKQKNKRKKGNNNIHVASSSSSSDCDSSSTNSHCEANVSEQSNFVPYALPQASNNLKNTFGRQSECASANRSIISFKELSEETYYGQDISECSLFSVEASPKKSSKSPIKSHFKEQKSKTETRKRNSSSRSPQFRRRSRSTTKSPRLSRKRTRSSKTKLSRSPRRRSSSSYSKLRAPSSDKRSRHSRYKSSISPKKTSKRQRSKSPYYSRKIRSSSRRPPRSSGKASITRGRSPIASRSRYSLSRRSSSSSSKGRLFAKKVSTLRKNSDSKKRKSASPQIKFPSSSKNSLENNFSDLGKKSLIHKNGLSQANKEKLKHYDYSISPVRDRSPSYPRDNPLYLPISPLISLVPSRTENDTISSEAILKKSSVETSRVLVPIKEVSLENAIPIFSDNIQAHSNSNNSRVLIPIKEAPCPYSPVFSENQEHLYTNTNNSRVLVPIKQVPLPYPPVITENFQSTSSSTAECIDTRNMFVSNKKTSFTYNYVTSDTKEDSSLIKNKSDSDIQNTILNKNERSMNTNNASNMSCEFSSSILSTDTKDSSQKVEIMHKIKEVEQVIEYLELMKELTVVKNEICLASEPAQVDFNTNRNNFEISSSNDTIRKRDVLQKLELVEKAIHCTESLKRNFSRSENSIPHTNELLSGFNIKVKTELYSSDEETMAIINSEKEVEHDITNISGKVIPERKLLISSVSRENRVKKTDFSCFPDLNIKVKNEPSAETLFSNISTLDSAIAVTASSDILPGLNIRLKTEPIEETHVSNSSLEGNVTCTAASSSETFFIPVNIKEEPSEKNEILNVSQNNVLNTQPSSEIIHGGLKKKLSKENSWLEKVIHGWPTSSSECIPGLDLINEEPSGETQDSDISWLSNVIHGWPSCPKDFIPGLDLVKEEPPVETQVSRNSRLDNSDKILDSNNVPTQMGEGHSEEETQNSKISMLEKITNNTFQAQKQSPFVEVSDFAFKPMSPSLPSISEVISVSDTTNNELDQYNYENRSSFQEIISSTLHNELEHHSNACILKIKQESTSPPLSPKTPIQNEMKPSDTSLRHPTATLYNTFKSDNNLCIENCIKQEPISLPSSPKAPAPNILLTTRVPSTNTFKTTLLKNVTEIGIVEIKPDSPCALPETFVQYEIQSISEPVYSNSINRSSLQAEPLMPALQHEIGNNIFSSCVKEELASPVSSPEPPLLTAEVQPRQPEINFNTNKSNEIQPNNTEKELLQPILIAEVISIEPRLFDCIPEYGNYVDLSSTNHPSPDHGLPSTDPNSSPDDGLPSTEPNYPFVDISNSSDDDLPATAPPSLDHGLPSTEPLSSTEPNYPLVNISNYSSNDDLPSTAPPSPDHGLPSTELNTPSLSTTSHIKLEPAASPSPPLLTPIINLPEHVINSNFNNACQTINDYGSIKQEPISLPFAVSPLIPSMNSSKGCISNSPSLDASQNNEVQLSSKVKLEQNKPTFKILSSSYMNSHFVSSQLAASPVTISKEILTSNISKSSCHTTSNNAVQSGTDVKIHVSSPSALSLSSPSKLQKSPISSFHIKNREASRKKSTQPVYSTDLHTFSNAWNLSHSPSVVTKEATDTSYNTSSNDIHVKTNVSSFSTISNALSSPSKSQKSPTSPYHIKNKESRQSKRIPPVYCTDLHTSTNSRNLSHSPSVVAEKSGDFCLRSISPPNFKSSAHSFPKDSFSSNDMRHDSRRQYRDYRNCESSRYTLPPIDLDSSTSLITTDLLPREIAESNDCSNRYLHESSNSPIQPSDGNYLLLPQSYNTDTPHPSSSHWNRQITARKMSPPVYSTGLHAVMVPTSPPNQFGWSSSRSFREKGNRRRASPPPSYREETRSNYSPPIPPTSNSLLKKRKHSPVSSGTGRERSDMERQNSRHRPSAASSSPDRITIHQAKRHHSPVSSMHNRTTPERYRSIPKRYRNQDTPERYRDRYSSNQVKSSQSYLKRARYDQHKRSPERLKSPKKEYPLEYYSSREKFSKRRRSRSRYH